MSDIGKDFMRQTRYPHLTLSPQKQGLPQPPLQSPLPPDAGRIVLPKPEDLVVPAMDLRTAIEIRTSVRRYTGEALTLEELSYLLWCTQGVRSSTPKATFRNVPSAGARHAFETYLQINRVADLKPGIYRYAALEHELVEMDCSAETNERSPTPVTSRNRYSRVRCHLSGWPSWSACSGATWNAAIVTCTWTPAISARTCTWLQKAWAAEYVPSQHLMMMN